jgi:hypothetical protein
LVVGVDERSGSRAPVLARFGVLAVGGRGVTRWSARLLLASVLFGGLTPVEVDPGHLFDSLSAELRDLAICTANVPWWAAAVGLVVGFRMIVGALWMSVAGELTGAPIVVERPLARYAEARGLRMEILSVWRSPYFTGFRRRVIWGATCWAALSGLLSALLAAAVLHALPVSSSLLIWAIIAAGSLLITRVEGRMTEQRYASHAPAPEVPSARTARLRARSYASAYPAEAHTAMPLLYGYTGLDRQELAARSLELGTSRTMTRGPQLVALVLVALLYPFLPAPVIAPAASDGLAACLFHDLYDFFAVTQQNIALSSVAAGLLLLAMPVSVLLSYVTLMRPYRVPAAVQADVLGRETLFALRMILYAAVLAILGAALTLVLLLASAYVATWLDSPVAGMAVLLATVPAAWLYVRRIQRRRW